MIHQLPRVSPKLLCALAYLGYAGEAGKSLLILNSKSFVSKQAKIWLIEISDGLFSNQLCIAIISSTFSLVTAIFLMTTFLIFQKMCCIQLRSEIIHKMMHIHIIIISQIVWIWCLCTVVWGVIKLLKPKYHFWIEIISFSYWKMPFSISSKKVSMSSPIYKMTPH